MKKPGPPQPQLNKHPKQQQHTEKGKAREKPPVAAVPHGGVSKTKAKKKKRTDKTSGSMGGKKLTADVMQTLSERVTEEAGVHVESLSQSEKAGFTARFVEEVTGQAGAFKSRVENKSVAVVNPDAKKKVSKPPARVPMSSRDKRRLRLNVIPADCRKFAMYEPLHELWSQYIAGVLGAVSPSDARGLDAAQQKVAKADYHGALMTVERSLCPSVVGISGIMVKETRHMFNVITRKDELKEIPKINTVFTFEVGGVRYHLHGNQILCQSGERSAKKFKAKATIDL